VHVCPSAIIVPVERQSIVRIASRSSVSRSMPSASPMRYSVSLTLGAVAGGGFFNCLRLFAASRLGWKVFGIPTYCASAAPAVRPSTSTVAVAIVRMALLI
jgi:hypothetical protein